ncbi:MAG TPA: tetraacyldisaccharide 4'-kinase, partial [Thiotrichales bacterium]|nr:tetraacyldisaccharide 4'-kinase [Thiotrichales bacterium]
MNYWYSQNPLAWLSWPLSLLFCSISFIRRFCYRSGILKSTGFNIPVVIVGNISVGGTGKTPLLISLCRYLEAQGKKVGVVSRGYGGRVSGVKQLADTDDASEVGDEPCLIFQRTGCPVVVGRDRVAAVDQLLKNNDCDIVLSDDGLQHYRLQRQREIAVIDAKRLHGNGFCLPAGPLRERRRRLQSVDLVVYNGEPHKPADACFYTLAFDVVINLQSGEQQPLSFLQKQKLLAVAGIGNPQRFFDVLTRQSLAIDERAYSDHYHYSDEDIQSWSGQCVLMTEKDAVKCRRRVRQKKISGDFSQLWYLPVTAVFNDRLEQSLGELFTASSAGEEA